MSNPVDAKYGMTHDQILESIKIRTCGPIIIPAIIIPNRLGNFIFLQIQPANNPDNKIKPIEKSM